jgi:hypothetical protein
VRSGEDATGSSRLDGGLTDVVRVGETIHRSTSPGTQAVHALLVHLELVGFEGAPRVLGFDAEGREVLSFIVGGGPSHTDDELALVAQLIRELHNSTEAFAGPPDLQWQFMVGAPQQGDVVCHNDLLLTTRSMVRAARHGPSLTGISPRPHPVSGMWRGLSTDSSRSTMTRRASDWATRSRHARRDCASSAMRMSSMTATHCFRRCANASGSSTTLRASGAKPVGRVGATSGTTRAASNGYADCDTSRRNVVSGRGS